MTFSLRDLFGVLLLVIGASWLVIHLTNKTSDALRAEIEHQDSIIRVREDSIAVRDDRIQAITGELEALESSYAEDTISWQEWRAREARIRATEQRNLRQALDSLNNLITDPGEQALVREIELAHAEVRKTLENEISGLENRVESLERIRATQHQLIFELQEQLEDTQGGWDAERAIREALERELASQKGELWLTRVAAGAATVCALLSCIKIG